jgi:hypothetical protein
MRYRLYCLMAAIFGLAVTVRAWSAVPPGWIIAGNAPTNYAYKVDALTPVSGSRSASITAKPSATGNGFGTLMQMITADDYRGSRLRLSGYLRTRNADRARLWMRVDGPDQQVLAFDNMGAHPVTGTRGWQQYDIVLDVPQKSLYIAFGFLLHGSGKVWGADFKLDKVGATIPVTSRGPILPRKPENLNFEAAAAQQGIKAVWAPRHVRFIYQGTNALYSCDGLLNQIVYLLSKMGPRNLKADEGPCPRAMGGPVRLPSVDVRMQVLVPAAEAKQSQATPVVRAHWQKVILSGRTLVPLYGQPSQVLIEQFKETLLPLFTTRNVRYSPTGAPPHLSAEILLPDANAVR